MYFSSFLKGTYYYIRQSNQKQAPLVSLFHENVFKDMHDNKFQLHHSATALKIVYQNGK